MPVEADALPVDWEVAVPLDAAVVEERRLAEAGTFETDAEDTSDVTETRDEGTAEATAGPVCVWELEPALMTLEAEGPLGGEIIDGNGELEAALEALKADGILAGEFVDGDGELESALETLEAEVTLSADGTLNAEFIDGDRELEPAPKVLEARGTLAAEGDAVETEGVAVLLEADVDGAGSGDAGAGFDGTGAGLLGEGVIDSALDLPVAGVGSTVTVVVPTIVVVPGVIDPSVTDAGLPELE